MRDFRALPCNRVHTHRFSVKIEIHKFSFYDIKVGGHMGQGPAHNGE